MNARGFARYLLNQLGFEDICEAENGRAAVHQLQVGDFDLVVSDWNMPEVDGMLLFQLMRKFPRTRSVPFILMTNQNDHDKVRFALKSGVDGYLIKPLSLNSLHQSIHSLLK